MNFIAIDYRTESSNTSEHGYGDYPEKIYFVKAVVKADSKRKAMNKIRKAFQNIHFSGINSVYLMSEDEYNESHWLEEFGEARFAATALGCFNGLYS